MVSKVEYTEFKSKTNQAKAASREEAHDEIFSKRADLIEVEKE